MFHVYDWPTALLHLDGDSFFASVIQATRPHLKGKPLVTGRERGVATAISPEAKKFGITRAMSIAEVKKRFPQVIVVDSDYELYHLFSQKMFRIMRRYSPAIEEYSIDEGFADIKGLRRPLNMSYEEIGRKMKDEVESSLGISVSVGISLTKSLAKIASSFRKPSGLTVIPGRSIHDYLKKVPLGDIWGIGPQTGAYLQKLGVITAYDFASKPEEFIREKLAKPFFEIWQELRGIPVYGFNSDKKSTYQSITRSRSFPATADPHILWSRLTRHIEEAFGEARRFSYHAGRISLYLKTQEFRFHHKEIAFSSPVQYPHTIKKELRDLFDRIYTPRTPYRTAGCTITDLQEVADIQTSLFADETSQARVKKVYPLIESGKVHFGSSLYEQRQLKEKKPTTFSIPMMNLSDLTSQ